MVACQRTKSCDVPDGAAQLPMTAPALPSRWHGDMAAMLLATNWYLYSLIFDIKIALE